MVGIEDSTTKYLHGLLVGGCKRPSWPHLPPASSANRPTTHIRRKHGSAQRASQAEYHRALTWLGLLHWRRAAEQCAGHKGKFIPLPKAAPIRAKRQQRQRLVRGLGRSIPRNRHAAARAAAKRLAAECPCAAAVGGAALAAAVTGRPATRGTAEAPCTCVCRPAHADSQRCSPSALQGAGRQLPACAQAQVLLHAPASCEPHPHDYVEVPYNAIACCACAAVAAPACYLFRGIS